MAKIIVNDQTLTQVLDGAGFCFSEQPVAYYFGADATSAEAAGRIPLEQRCQMNGTNGQIMWAKSTDFPQALVVATAE